MKYTPAHTSEAVGTAPGLRVSLFTARCWLLSELEALGLGGFFDASIESLRTPVTEPFSHPAILSFLLNARMGVQRTRISGVCC